MVHKAILNHIKKNKIPYAAVISGLLFSFFDSIKVNANNNPNNSGLLPKTYILNQGEDYSFVKELENSYEFIKSLIIGSKEIFEAIGNAIVWLIHLPENIHQYSIDLLTYVFELLTRIVLQTPAFLFDNVYFKDATLTFTLISIGIVTILSMIESIKQMLRLRHTDFKKIMKRYAAVVAILGFTPILFKSGFELLNKITRTVLQIGTTALKPENMTEYLTLSNFNTLTLIVFDLMILAMMIPLLLQNGRRWFDILTSAIITPLSLTAWIFDDYRHLFHKWWDNLKKLSLTQLVYAIYIVIISLFIFGTRYITDTDGLLVKMLIILGGMWRLLNPPSFVLSMTDKGKDVIEMADDIKKTTIKAKDTITFKKFRKPLTSLKDKLFSKK